MNKKRRILDFNDFTDFNKRRDKRVKTENFEDYSGVVHYRESSKLLRSPPGYDVSKSIKSPEKEKITLEEGSLFNMCLKFMSMNVHLIDSLVGMPEIIGQQLFSYMIQEKIFNFEMNAEGYLSAFDQLKIRKLVLFGEAYNDLLLRSLTFVDVPKNFDFVPLMCSFPYLVELDLSGRKLPEGVFSVLSKFYSLEKLILQNNMLTDESIVKFTLPYRMYKENPQTLEVLDIGDNDGVTNTSIERLLSFTSLKTLNLSGTSVSMHFGLVYELKQFGWQLSRDEPAYSYPSNVGWAEPIISYLQKRQKMENTCDTKAARFYSTCKENVLQVPIKKSNLILIRSWFPKHSIKFNKEVLEISEQNKPLCGSQNKKSANSSVCKNGKSEKALSIKQDFFSRENDDAEDIFNLY